MPFFSSSDPATVSISINGLHANSKLLAIRTFPFRVTLGGCVHKAIPQRPSESGDQPASAPLVELNNRHKRPWPSSM
jgi:hypothetical protein